MSMDDNYCTYKIHIVRNNETLDDVAAKYDITTQKIKEYNDTSNIMLGSKLIIPSNE